MARRESYRDQIIEFLIDNQSYIKDHMMELMIIKNDLIKRENPVFKQDLEAQYEARIKQWVSFFTAERLAIPVEYIIIELERIDVEEYLNV